VLFMLVTLVVFAGYAYISAVFRDRVLGAPAARRWVERTIGALLIGFAARLALSDR
jgi:threonine/homoserine/homoserine lactone efflux protein